jgi:hypothetical protein
MGWFVEKHQLVTVKWRALLEHVRVIHSVFQRQNYDVYRARDNAGNEGCE